MPDERWEDDPRTIALQAAYQAEKDRLDWMERVASDIQTDITLGKTKADYFIDIDAPGEGRIVCGVSLREAIDEARNGSH